MKKIVLTFGLLSGLVMSAMMVASIPLWNRIDPGAAEVLGYTTMVAASLFIYFGVRRYRDIVAGGAVSFGRALVVGTLIGLVAGACYTATWEVIYFGGGARFGDEVVARYQEHELAAARAGGATAAELEQQRAKMARYAEMYHNPAINAAMTFLEPLPVVIVAALISAGVLGRRRRGDANAPTGVPHTV